MTTIFVGGSRHVARLPDHVKGRLDAMMRNGHHIVVGDAPGVDKAVQAHLRDAAYDRVTVFCSGDRHRNNLGGWRMNHVAAPRAAKGFQFYAAKDREMARCADFGLMIWDGRSPGTVLNVLRLVRAGKIVVLVNVPADETLNVKSAAQWDDFLSRCDAGLLDEMRRRATAEEWSPAPAAPDRLAVGA